MLKTHWRLISRLERIADNLLVVLAFVLSYHFRDELLSFFSAVLPRALSEQASALAAIEDYYIVLGFSLLVFNFVLSLLGAYRSMRLSTFWELIKLSATSSLLVFLSQGSILYLLKLDLSRSFVGLFCALSGVFLLVERWLILRLLRYFRARGKNFRNVLIVGTGQQARRAYIEISKQIESGLKVAGFIELHKADATHRSCVYDLPARVLADTHGFEAALKRHTVDEVFFTDVVENFVLVQNLAEIAVEEGVRVTLAADLFSLEIFQSDLSYLGEVPLIHYHPTPGASDNMSHVVKRIIDLLVSTLLLIILSPFLLIVAAAIKLTSAGPVFFRQKRVGLNGRHFILLKFRSMVADAEQMLPKLLDKNEMVGPVFKIKNDPRITRLGKFIRRFSIDELPQLINILRGDMSLVGPRPPLPEEVSLYGRKHRKRLSMRPGLTCTWQVSGRNEIPDFEKWAALDLEYIDNWSLTNDFKLLLRTIPAVFSGSGAR